MWGFIKNVVGASPARADSGKVLCSPQAVSASTKWERENGSAEPCRRRPGVRCEDRLAAAGELGRIAGPRFWRDMFLCGHAAVRGPVGPQGRPRGQEAGLSGLRGRDLTGDGVCQGSPFSLRIPAVSRGRPHPGESLPQGLSPPSLQVARSPARLGGQHTARVAGPQDAAWDAEEEALKVQKDPASGVVKTFKFLLHF